MKEPPFARAVPDIFYVILPTAGLQVRIVPRNKFVTGGGAVIVIRMAQKPRKISFH
jgi:hypothetical protein